MYFRCQLVVGFKQTVNRVADVEQGFGVLVGLIGLLVRSRDRNIS